MPPIKKFESTLSCNVPQRIKQKILEVARAEGLSQSDVTRELLEVGLRARGLEAEDEAA